MFSAVGAQRTLAIVGLGILLIGGLYWWHGNLLSEIDQTQSTIRKLEKEIKTLKAEASRVEEFEDETTKLEDKLVAIDKLRVQKLVLPCFRRCRHTLNWV